MYDELIKTLRLRAALWEKMYDEDNVLKQAADAIEELEMITDNLKYLYKTKVPKWIPVTERLPKDDTICILTDGVSEAIGYRGKVFGWHLIWTDYLAESDITHWMPLPQLPKEG